MDTKAVYLFISGVLVGALGLLIFSPQKKCDNIVFTKAENCGDVKGVSSDIVIDVSGAVASPGVYKLPSGSRVSDAIKSAGDVLADKVDKMYLAHNINLAKVLQDGAKLYIPFAGEQADSSQKYHFGSGTSVSDSVNINEASESELVSKLGGIGPKRAEKIVAGRPYSRIEDLYEKNIISKSLFEKIKGDITVN